MSGTNSAAHFAHLLRKCLLLYVRTYLLIDKYIQSKTMTQDEKEQILQKLLETVEYRNYVQNNSLFEIGRFTEYDFQFQTLLSVISMTIENKDIPKGLEKVYEAIIDYKDIFLSINNSIDAINNDDVVNAIKNISFNDIIALIDGLYNKTDNLEKGQQETIKALNSIVDKMNIQQNITVQVFNDICDKLNKIVENTSTNEHQTEQQPKQPKDYETLLVKSSENGISCVGGWHIKPSTKQLETVYGKLKVEGSKEVIPTDNATITTTIKYTDGRTGKLKTYNGGFEYATLPKTSTSSSTATTKQTNKVQKDTSSSTILNKPKEKSKTTETKPITKYRLLGKGDTSSRTYIKVSTIVAKREWMGRVLANWKPTYHGEKPPRFPG